MPEKKWKLGEDLGPKDSLLDGLLIEDLILALRHSSVVTYDTAKKNLQEMLAGRLEDMWYIFANNIDEIISAALEGRNV